LLALPQQNQKTKAPQHSSQTDQRGSQDSPLVVKVIPPAKTKEETEQETKDRNDKATNDRNLVKGTYILAGIGLLEFVVFGYQAIQLRKTVQSAAKQSEAMERYIAEAERSATAMETISNVIEDGNKAVMRAYLTVLIGDALWQERRVGQDDLKFEAKPNIVNTGSTPARKLRIRIRADILPIPIPATFDFPLPPADDSYFAGSIGAHQTSSTGSVINYFVPDAEVASIKEGMTKALCVWGNITYEDIFGNPHYTKFGQWLTWLPSNQLFGYYTPNQNDGD